MQRTSLESSHPARLVPAQCLQQCQQRSVALRSPGTLGWSRASWHGGSRWMQTNKSPNEA